MKERKSISTLGEKRLLDSNEVCMYLSLGRSRGVELARTAGSERKIGRRRLYDKKVIDHYLDELTEKEGVIL